MVCSNVTILRVEIIQTLNFTWWCNGLLLHFMKKIFTPRKKKKEKKYLLLEITHIIAYI